jgi:hypothetical protein
MEYVPWSAICKDYQLASNGVKYPTKFQAVWNYPDGDFVYFDGSISEISYPNLWYQSFLSMTFSPFP